MGLIRGTGGTRSVALLALHGAVALLAALVLLTVAIPASPALAHTELESSEPAAGATVVAPVAEIVLVFTAAVAPVDDGMEVLDPSGRIRRPDAVAAPDDRTLVLRFSEPLTGGGVGVRWAVTAADGHLIEGAFDFTVDAPPPPPPTEPRPPTTAAQVPPTTAATTSSPETASAPTTAGPPTTDAAPTTVTTVSPPAEPITLEDFLGRTSGRDGDLQVRRVAQVVGVVATLLAVGLVGFVVTVLAGRAGAVPGLLRPAAVAALVAAAAAVLEAGAHAGAVTGEGLGVLGDPRAVLDALGGTYGTAIVLRVAGGLLVAAGLLLAARRSGGAAGDWPHRVPPPLAAGGAVALVVSYAFDGHTVSKGNRVVQFLVDVVHVSAGALWAGGVVALSMLAWRHRRRSVSAAAAAGSSPLELTLRFSAVASWALLAVVAAGTVMTIGIIDGVGDLTGTPWGKTLLFKVAATAVAAACGAYNRYRILPALSAAPTDATVRERARDALAAEAFLLTVAMVLAGVLAGATV